MFHTLPYIVDRSQAKVVLSLDFEMRWGLYHQLRDDHDVYRENLEGVREVVPSLLSAFTRFQIACTWATVGALACHHWDEYFRWAPPPPRYRDQGLIFSRTYQKLDPEGSLYFCPDLVSMVERTPQQELATHTFSHILLREPGVCKKDLEEDLKAVLGLHASRGWEPPKSIVFPQNQIAWIDIVQNMGIQYWRGNEDSWYFNANEQNTNLPLPRLIRMADALNPTRRRACLPEGGMTRSSLFFRPTLKPFLWNMHLSRILHELRTIQPGEIFHLWWHPHNMGAQPALCLKRLELVLAAIAEGVQEGRFISSTLRNSVRNLSTIL